MKPMDLYTRTMPFILAKFILGMINFAASVVLLLIFVGIGHMMGETAFAIGIILWLIGTGICSFILITYFGYLVKAGHIAVVTEAIQTGKIPENQVAYGKEEVKKRFLSINVYMATDRLISGAVRQIQRGIEAIGGVLDFVPGMSSITGVVNVFLGIALGYIDECCLAYTFYKKDEGAMKSAADGVVIYADQWKPLLKSAFMTLLKVSLLTVVGVLVIFFPLSALFSALHWHPVIALFLSIFLAMILKFSFVDSFIMVQMVTAYFKLAQNASPSYDLYGKLCGISKKFRELFEKGQKETPNTPIPESAK